MTSRTLDDVLAAPSPAACAALLQGMTPDQRRQLGAEVLRRHKQFQAEDHTAESRSALLLRIEQGRALTLLCFLTLPPSEWTEQLLLGLPLEAGEVAAKLKLPGFDSAAERLIELTPRNYLVARALVREGVSRRPTHDNYTLGLLYDTRFDENPLDVDPDVREHEVWRLFEVEGGGERSLAARDKYTSKEQTWTQAFLRHMRQGTLERGRLLDATLGALERDFAAFRAGWFSRFHEAMEPTPEELEQHRDRYLRLLGSSIPATVSLALEAVTTLHARRPLDLDSALPALEPVVLARHKGTALQAVKLLKSMGTSAEGEERERVALVLVMGFSHEAVDVQKAVLKVLESLAKTPGDSLRAAVAERVDGVAASLKPQVQAWLGQGEAPAAKRLQARPGEDSASSTTPAGPASGNRPAATAPASPTDARFAVSPITTVDELIAALSSCIEDAGSPMAVERVLDGVARLGRQRPDDFARKTSALAQRAKKLGAKSYGEPLSFHLVCLALAWLAPAGEARATLRELPCETMKHEHDVFVRLFNERIQDIALALDAGRDDGLLSMPTHDGGWIAPETLVDRLRSRAPGAGEPSRADLGLALYRLAPLEATPQRIKESPQGHALQVLAWALRMSETAPSMEEPLASIAARIRGDTPPIRYTYAVQARGTKPYIFREVFITAEPPATRHERTASWDLPNMMTASNLGDVLKPYPRWMATLWPSGMEAYFASQAYPLSFNLDWNSAVWGNVASYEQLLHPWLRMGPMARLVLAMGLSAKEPGEHGVSADATLAALDTGRLTAEDLGEMMSELRPTGLINSKRWAATLARVASTSEAHALQVACILQRTLRKTEGPAPRDDGALMKLLLELLAQTRTRLTDTEAWDFIQGTSHRKTFEPLAPTASAAPPPPPAAPKKTPRKAARRPPSGGP
ncbi:ribonucleotide reductase [Myxococcus stipitatus DSM 14675]|uniref:Ribonucleotide reductase n=1 Tax=Myxococcus stipitatus (strain DSM 14675 / JCM 12634 / Mx s8) TaxID=1278073 RepID=L7UNQ1_MYXSD|nr:DUF6493 family protein [Myxococcus stipitatus]AGC48104.1 ribonucleotide reductase [Myxococcus stipitatus DSM 14675]